MICFAFLQSLRLASQATSLYTREAFFYLPEGKEKTFDMQMSKVPLRYFCHSRVCGIFVLLFLLGSNSGKQSKQQSHSSQQHSKPCSPLPRQTVGSPGVSSVPVTSITFLEISLFIYPPSAYKRCAPKGTHRKNASPQFVVTQMLSQRRYEEKEKTLFTKSIFPSSVRTYAICVTSIFYHISVGLSIKVENLTKISLLLLLLWCL